MLFLSTGVGSMNSNIIWSSFDTVWSSPVSPPIGVLFCTHIWTPFKKNSWRWFLHHFDRTSCQHPLLDYHPAINPQNLTQFPSQSFCKILKTFVPSKTATNDVSFKWLLNRISSTDSQSKAIIDTLSFTLIVKWLIKLDHTRTWCHLSFLTPSQRAWPLGNRLWPRCIATDRNRPFWIPTSTELGRFPRFPINERDELTFLLAIRTLGVIASLLQRVSNYHRTSNTNQPAISPLARETSQAARKKRSRVTAVFAGSYHQRHLVNLRSAFLQSN